MMNQKLKDRIKQKKTEELLEEAKRKVEETIEN